MSSFVSLPNPTRIGLHLHPRLLDAAQLRQLNSKFGVEIRKRWTPLTTTQGGDGQGIAPLQADLISGKDAGSKVDTIGPNQRAVLTLGTIQPPKYQALIVVNPEFNTAATVQHPQLVEPKELTVLRLVINAHTTLRLADLEWLCRVYLVE